MDIKQHADGSVSWFSPREGVSLTRVGGPKTPTATVPNFRGTQWIKLSAAGGTDTGGGVSSFTNNFGYDLIITNVIIDVTTIATGACGLDVGTTAVSGTTAATNLVANQDVHSATGSFTPGTQIAVHLANGSFITAGTHAGGASAGLVANLYVEYMVA